MNCSIEGCPNQRFARGLCRKHYHRARRKGELSGFTNCSVEGCPRSQVGRTLCELHYRRKRTTGKLGISIAPKGAGTIYQGYRRFNLAGRRIHEHRLILERVLGRRLNRSEIVHHINGDRLDNRLENLKLMSPSQHTQLHNLGRGGTGGSSRVNG